MNLGFDPNNVVTWGAAGTAIGMVMSILFSANFWKKRNMGTGLDDRLRSLELRANQSKELHGRIEDLEKEKATLVRNLEAASKGVAVDPKEFAVLKSQLEEESKKAGLLANELAARPTQQTLDQALAKAEALTIEVAELKAQPKTDPTEFNEMKRRMEEAEHLANDLKEDLSTSPSRQDFDLWKRRAEDLDQQVRNLEPTAHEAEALRRRAESAEAQVATLRTQVDEAHSGNADELKAEISRLQTELESASSAGDQSSEVKRLKEELEAAHSAGINPSALADLQRESEAQIQALSAQISEFERERQELRSKIDSMQERSKTSGDQSELQQSFDELKRLSDADKVVLAAAQQKAGIAERELAQLKKRSEEMIAALTEQGRVAQEQLTRDNTVMKEQIARYDEQFKGLLDQIETELSKQRAEKVQLEENLNRLREEAANAQVSAHESKEHLEQELQELNAQVRDLQKSEGKLAEVTSANESLQRELANLRKTHLDLEEELSDLRDRSSKFQIERKGLQDELETRLAQIEEFAALNQKLQAIQDAPEPTFNIPEPPVMPAPVEEFQTESAVDMRIRQIQEALAGKTNAPAPTEHLDEEEDNDDVSEGPLNRISGLTNSAREKLLKAGIDSYTQLASTPPIKLREITGVNDIEELEAWVSQAVILARDEVA